MSVFDLLLDLLFPRRCLSCSRFGQYLCDHCRLEIDYLEKNLCPVCQREAIDGRTHPRCQTKYTLDGLSSVFRYKDPVREAIRRIKYKPFAFDIAKSLVGLALEKINEEDSLFSSLAALLKKKPVLVPIPLHSSRERVRGFNQAEVLGKILAEEWELAFVGDLLLRKRPTKPQYGLKKKERQKNVRGVFGVNPRYNSDNFYNRFLLFDDVWTTGATMRSCGNALKRAGARFVWGLTLAR